MYKCTCMNKCFKWHFYSSRRTPVHNYFDKESFFFFGGGEGGRGRIFL